MSALTQAELAYLRGEHRLARLATVGPDGTPHITPVGMWSVDPDSGVVEVTGHNFTATKKFRDVARTGRAAIVIDDVLPPFRPRGVEIRGHAEAIGDPEPRIRIYPERIVGWGLDDSGRRARSVARDSGEPRP
ncbi:MAG TPA: PPOX class F420-dependent oxidoreductase [Jiangellaceae bacterium]|nr:PPOX class F420-dependent oxidoreductase [Jiangellaceae bacterium]